MLRVQNLSACAWEKEILKNLDISFETGKNYCILGKNGSWKSTLSSVIAGSPKYTTTSGTIDIDGQDVLSMTPEERSLHGVFLSFQNVPEIKWVNLAEYLRTIYNNVLVKKTPETKALSPFVFKRFVKKFLDELKIDEEFLSRDLNVGFSGWEKRKIEILQMKLLEPKYIILDEIDSGLDLDAFKTIATLLKTVNTRQNTFIIITHYFSILDYVNVDTVMIMKNGAVVREWGKDLIEQVKELGYENF